MLRSVPQRFVAALLCAALVVAGALIASPPGARAAVLSLAITSTAPGFAVTLNGTNQAPTDQLTIHVTDTTGTQAGWHLAITSTQFTTGGATPRTLATNALRITGATATATCAAGPDCVTPTNSIAHPLTVPAGPTAPAAVKFYNAAAGTGMGEFDIKPSLQLSVPANAYAGSYTSTITITVASGP